MNANIITTNGGLSDIIPGTTWTYGDAASMAKEVARENRLFGNGRNTRRRRTERRSDVGLMVTDPARFTAETGWTPEDALAEAIEHRRDARLYGTRH